MPAREILVVSMVEGRWDTVTPKGLQAIRDADLIAHDDTISRNLRRRWPKQARTWTNATLQA